MIIIIIIINWSTCVSEISQVCRTVRHSVDPPVWPVPSFSPTGSAKKRTNKQTSCTALNQRPTKKRKQIMQSNSTSIAITELQNVLSNEVILQGKTPCLGNFGQNIWKLFSDHRGAPENLFNSLLASQKIPELSGSYFMFQQTEKSNGFDWS